MATSTHIARDRARRVRALMPSLAATLGLVLVPKCPLCVTAYLTGLGLSAGVTAWVAPLVRPGAIALSVCALALALLAAFRWLAVRSGRPARGHQRPTQLA